uniref:NADH-ubiquinone oxidoreductase chain 6 n=1 Tax=Kisaura zhejiangensis (nom. nud.) TaxID=2904921 RepID=A0A9E8LQ71_9NEOP|nr:NADH dehydrogenase subunit 6 [Kisaura zhejiangensis (nom. nud.)]UZZ44075.1 NADH dehydrogenase subunit 6 [Kisaura zhejiangensis (nom. nud.)]
MKLLIMNLMLMSNLIFISLNHPMSMGFIIMIQLILSTLLMNFYTQLSWFSLILFLIFIGGMMILFTYMCSISSNNIILLSPKMILMIYSFILMNLLMMMLLNWNQYLMNNWMNLNNYFMNLNIQQNSMNYLMKMFNNYSMNLMFFLIIYLFILMIMVNKITNLNMGPLRKNN